MKQKQTPEERKESIRRAKRDWSRRNGPHVRAYRRAYKERTGK